MPRFLIIFIAIVFIGCQEELKKDTLYVAVAANAQFAVAEIIREFEETAGFHVEMIVGSSGKLTAQIEQGAPYHVLLSANMKYPEYLFSGGLAASEPEIYAKGRLVLWSIENEKPLEPDSLTSKQFRTVAIANPLNAPYGEAAVNVLQKAGIYDSVKDKLVYGESISQTTQFIYTGSADAGFTALSVLKSPQFAGQGSFREVPDILYPPIEQGMVILKAGNNRKQKDARAFRDFVFSEKSRRILEKWGYRI